MSLFDYYFFLNVDWLKTTWVLVQGKKEEEDEEEKEEEDPHRRLVVLTV